MKKRIVVLGAGFAGLEFCKRINLDVCEVVLIDRNNHHLFQPLLYQVATAGLSMPEIAKPIRSVLRPSADLRVLMATVTAIDLEKREVHADDQRFPYDYLVIALGAVTSYFGKDHWARFAPGLKTLEDAMQIRRDVLHAFERAEIEPDHSRHQSLMTVVVVGGGPTGVELAGAFVELANHVLKRDFQNIDPSQARIVLVEAGPKILSQFPDPLPAKAVETLKEMGVEVRLNCPVQDIGEGFVRLPDETIHAANIIWGAGVMGHPLTRTLGVELDRGGRIKVMPDLSLPGHPEVFAVGDLVSLVDVNGQVVPGVSPAAIQMGGFVAKIINAEASGSSDSAKRPGFAYRDKGIMATIGRSKGVAFIASMKFTGFLAWLLWLGVHLIFLIGFRNKLAVLLQWFYSYVNYKRGARIIVDLPRSQPPG